MEEEEVKDLSERIVHEKTVKERDLEIGRFIAKLGRIIIGLIMVTGIGFTVYYIVVSLT